ncbi:Raf kinase inhibitor-like protein, YbhB/YbcL family [Nostoc sp. PCC 7524]|uniref:YbhB/YbcL family Raf kinase inhibitor-like protein n=1 Tax=Nostoc sp. (strain ATCC 29411 / PCC 7524) TaxID=28072 RepID=UPI00029F1F93|nr:YbhB/YbcL family Raf kinase inhibitor-like protein [Nostoc sp. PCC 7524]AFY46507.1 Raf kinase inhibitor-like protein, YbhB/YbcL family [Nostoc sp. PCC 7524]
MRLLSNSFSADGMIPLKFSCEGEGISPSLKWEDAPIETQSFALIVDDPDAPNRTFVHWVLYDLPRQTNNLPEAIPNTPTVDGSGIQGKNDGEQFGYFPPCPPKGIHRYFFKLYALDGTLGLDFGATKEEVEAAMSGHILAKAELIGRYQKHHS